MASHLWYIWLIPAVILSMSMNNVLASKDETGLPENNANGNGNCPEYCTCIRRSYEGTIVKCNRITATQLFNDIAYTFVMKSSGKQPDDEHLQMGDRFFLNLQMKSVNTIIIVDINISSIDQNAFQGLNYLEQVNFTNNNIHVLHPDTFASNTGLRRLSLSQNSLSFSQNSQTSYILNIPSLRELDLSSCQLFNILPTTFSLLTELTYLNLASNMLKVIDQRTFSSMISLEEINLSDNSIQSLPSDIFRYNTVLDVLKLNNNPLKTIDNLVLPSLTALDVSFCRFIKVSKLNFVSLKQLNISSNAIREVDTDAFTNMTQLSFLDLSNNDFNGPLDPTIFLQNSELSTISLRDNPLMKELPANGFHGHFDDLYKFVASNCGLENVTTETFINMSNLAHLDLSNNAISSLDKGVLPRRLKYLSMAYNKIKSIDNIKFSTECQLRQLLLDGNPIKFLTPENFVNLPYLTKLQLQSCGMEKIWSDLTDEMPYLKNVHTLNLSNNKLTKITIQDLEVFSELNTLGIFSNPLACNQDLSELITYLKKAHIDSIAAIDVSNLPEKFEWEDIWTQICGKTKHIEKTSETSSSTKITNKKQESTTINDYYYYDEEDYDQENESDGIVQKKEDFGFEREDHDDKPHLVTFSYQLMVLAVVALATFVAVISLAVIFTVCKQRLMSQRARNNQISPGYKPLFNNEHMNTPTTPILKIRSIPLDLESSSYGHDEEMDTAAYTQTPRQTT